MGRMKRELIDREDHALQSARLADLLRGQVAVLCWCNRCGHRAEAPVTLLVAQLGPEFPVPEIGTRMRCGSCGSKDVATRPAWAAESSGARTAVPQTAIPQMATPQATPHAAMAPRAAVG
ncbi:MAG: hypothetical protein RLO51_06880 [Thalassobaculum sp.]|uniref:hypothetical protein n=1 Tax=Thalassobaculum sp. TaxID=2022740 RepID=UPI0032EBD9CF